MQPARPPALPDRAEEGDRAGPGAPPAGESASTVLDRVRSELVALHGTVVELQHALGPTLAAAAADGAVLRAGQALDLVAQSLDGLATFIGAASSPALGPGRLDAADAAARVKLDGLSARLAGRTPAAQPGQEIEFF